MAKMNLLRNLDGLKNINYYITRNIKYKIIYYCLIIGITFFAIGKNLLEAANIFSFEDDLPKGFEFYFSSPPKDPFMDVPRITTFCTKARMLDEPRFRPWPLDTQCSRFEIRLPFDIKKTFLLSYSSSGSSWLRYLFENAAGFYTGSINQDLVNNQNSYFHGGQANNDAKKTGWDHDNVFLVMAHSEQEMPHKHAKTILLLRCPESAILSNWQISKTGRSETNFETYKFRSFVKRQIKYWLLLHTFALTNMTRVLPIFYDDLEKDFVSELHNGLDYLKICPNEERIDCLRKYPNGPMKDIYSKNPYNNEELLLMRQAVTEVNKLLDLKSFRSLAHCDLN